MQNNPRQRIGETLTGDILEVGPGSIPFPTAPDAKIKFADRSVEGGRDANWPELKDAAYGPKAHFDVNLDTDNLSFIPDSSFDTVVASHVIEHLANPLKAICEFQRVLRPNGRLVLIVPDRSYTFDAIRAPTPFSHVLHEFQENVTEVDDEHIVDFCSAIYMQPPIHPEHVREWHNPEKLDANLFELHRRRSIHVHCWLPEEFASLIASAIAFGLMSWKFSGAYFIEDHLGSNEFGIVIKKSPSCLPKDLCRSFIKDWINAVLSKENSNPLRVVQFGKALQRDLAYMGEFSEFPILPLTMLAEELISTRDAKSNFSKIEQEILIQENEIRSLEQIILAMRNSMSWRMTEPIRKVKNLIRRS